MPIDPSLGPLGSFCSTFVSSTLAPELRFWTISTSPCHIPVLDRLARRVAAVADSTRSSMIMMPSTSCLLPPCTCPNGMLTTRYGSRLTPPLSPSTRLRACQQCLKSSTGAARVPQVVIEWPLWSGGTALGVDDSDCFGRTHPQQGSATWPSSLRPAGDQARQQLSYHCFLARLRAKVGRGRHAPMAWHWIAMALYQIEAGIDLSRLCLSRYGLCGPKQTVDDQFGNKRPDRNGGERAHTCC
ncbi:uncharacterized protein PSFLO_02908 [Pseudozyma flocculosa]|uniref:Uncharacterized protein n=1 Tax=Pseudozyma flocculosa TaxID=84751 RepID=A0A5C3F036_9BASI|nr:uncharacterized protein PSFLO_02908 [Pseudozyma flocculosa]